ncbi:type II secretion system F family protein [Candidatus Micrarchaeota archaeon]|nr:type II secretion system F family protein [Candidatus Micrarchaeota archaeon]
MATMQEQYEKFRRYYQATGFRISLPIFVGLIFLLSLFSGFMLYLFFGDLLTAFIGFFALQTLSVVFPISIRSGRIENVENNLPDALKHMAAILRAGGTTEDALEEVGNSDYGPLSADIKQGLMELKEGKPFDEVLQNIALTTGSPLFKRTATIIVDAKRAGAGLADVMEAIADDARDMIRIQRERISRTTMPVLFLYVSSLALAPFIFGFTLTIVCFIGSGMTSALGGAGLEIGNLKSLVIIFIGIQSAIAIMAIGIIKEGKPIKYLPRIPIMILISLVVFNVGLISGRLLIGSTAVCN